MEKSAHLCDTVFVHEQAMAAADAAHLEAPTLGTKNKIHTENKNAEAILGNSIFGPFAPSTRKR